MNKTLGLLGARLGRQCRKGYSLVAARRIFQDLKTTMTTEKEMKMAGVSLVHGKKSINNK